MSWRRQVMSALAVPLLMPLLLAVVLAAVVLPGQAADAADDRVLTARAGVLNELQSRCATLRAAAVGLAWTGPDLLEPASGYLVDRDVADSVVVRGGDAVVARSGLEVGDEPGDCLTRQAGGAPGDLSVTATAVGGAADTPLSITVTERLDARDLAALVRGVRADVVLLDADGTPLVATTDAPDLGDDVDAVQAAVDEPGTVAGRPVATTAAQPGLPQLAVLVEEGRAGTGTVLAVVAVGLLGMLAAVVLGARVARDLSRRLERLVATADALDAGQDDVVVPDLGDDEVGRTAHALRRALATVDAQVLELRERARRERETRSRIMRTLTATHDGDDLAQVVLEVAVDAAQGQGAVLWLASDDGCLEAQEAVGSAAGVRGAVLARGAGRPGRVRRLHEPLLLAPGAEAPVAADPAEPQADVVLAVPLVHRQVGGVLQVVGRRTTADVDEPALRESLEALRSFAEAAAVALDNVALHAEAQRLSVTDALTGLWNVRYLRDALRREVERAVRFERPLAVVVLDVDHFKDVNDRHGHQRGDAVLAELAQRVRAQVRDVDTVARYGGEELVVVLPETDGSGGRLLAERVREAVAREPFDGADRTGLAVTVSCGVADLPTCGRSADELVRAADDALYVAKASGRDRVVLARGPHDTSTPAADRPHGARAALSGRAPRP